jgi:hypothetical protein
LSALLISNPIEAILNLAQHPKTTFASGKFQVSKKKKKPSRRRHQLAGYSAYILLLP